VDTPESVHPNKQVEYFAQEAAAFTRRMVEGKRVRLEFDQANAVTGHKDNTAQKRTLAYVYLEDGTLLNAEIIRHGYGFALTRYPFARLRV
jgi:micrococcal nuclease